MKAINILSYIGLALFTIYAIFYYIEPNDAELMLFLLCLGSFGILPLLLLACCASILISCIAAFTEKKQSYIISVVWTAILILFCILIPSSYIDADVQEELYEKQKNELWKFAYHVEDLCQNRDMKSMYIWRKDDDGHSDQLGNLTANEHEQIRDFLKDMDYENISYHDSTCTFGIRYQGMALYSFTLGLHGKKLRDDYTRILYNDSVSFDFGCGAIGSCSYPNKDEYLEKKGKKIQD